jgi:acetyl-CoA C-acetyltransferase
MGQPVIVEAVRTPIGKRNGWLSGLKAAETLRHALEQVIARAGIDPTIVDEVIGGCVTQAGEQGSNVTRNAWLSAGQDRLPYQTACTTVDTKCGSAQQANHMAAALIAAGGASVTIGCGIEQMSHVPLGANVYSGPGSPKTEPWPWDDPPNGQFGAADRIADNRGITREDLDEWGFHSQRKAKQAWDEGRFEREVAPIETPVIGEDSQPTGEQQLISRDQGLRETTMEGLAKLKPVIEGSKHTAGTSSQISDGAGRGALDGRGQGEGTRCEAACATAPPARDRQRPVLPPRRSGRRDLQDARPLEDGDERLRRVRDQRGVRRGRAFVGTSAQARSRPRQHQRRCDRSRPPCGSTGARLITTALHELERADKELAFVTMCCGGSIGTASILQRI